MDLLYKHFIFSTHPMQLKNQLYRVNGTWGATVYSKTRGGKYLQRAKGPACLASYLLPLYLKGAFKDL